MIIQVGHTFLERFKAEHTNALYKLINTEEVRQGMRNNSIIPYHSHVEWVNKHVLNNPKTHLFIAMDQDEAKGVVLIKNMENRSGELGIMVRNIQEGRSTLFTCKLVTGILHYAFNTLQFEQLTMCILPKNHNSLTIAQKIGARFQYEDDTYKHFLLTKTDYQTWPLNITLLKRYTPRYLKTVHSF